MKTEEFNQIVEGQIEKIKSVLIKKADEYNLEEDRLGFFKRAGTFAQTTPEKALYGFLLKHLVSLNDMVVSGDKYSKELSVGKEAIIAEIEKRTIRNSFKVKNWQLQKKLPSSCVIYKKM